MLKKLFTAEILMIVIVLIIPVHCLKNSSESGHIPTVRQVRAVTSGPKHHFASAYYHFHSWSKNEKYLLCLETDVAYRNPEIGDKATVGMVEMETGEFLPLAETRAWNFQQGAMQQWLGSAPDSLIISNDFRNGNFLTVIQNVFTGAETTLSRPVSGVSPDGTMGVSLNYARIHRTRPGYGYADPGADPKLSEAYPDDDGLFIVDIETGVSRLIVSMADIYKQNPPPENAGGWMWFNHTIINQDNSRIFFLARSQKEMGGARVTAAYTVNPDGTDLRYVLPYNWGASHYDWFSADQLVVTSRFNGQRSWIPILFQDVINSSNAEDYRLIGGGAVMYDGHCAVSPDQNWIVYDSYPDAMRKQALMLIHEPSDAVYPIDRFYHGPEYSGPWRCDLHPRFNWSGDMICFDSVQDGTRQVYIAEIDTQ